ncbi:MAG: type II secretion system protein N [Burkholderiales bacterium]|jgi:hypothetical protein|nr:type II secretion system protein N [Burkholderiales bacterium]
MKKLPLIVITIFAFLIALVVFAPATLLDALVARATDDAWRLTQARGTLLQGDAALAYSHANRTVVLTPIAWKLDGAALLKGEIRFQFGETKTALGSTITARRHEIEISRLSLDLNAEVARNFLPTRAVQSLTGRISIDAPSLRISEPSILGNANARWKNAVLLINGQPLKLGEVQLTFADASAHISNQKGEIDIKGSAQNITPSSAPSGEITITPNAMTSDSTRQLLTVLGGDAPNTGNVVLRW